MTSNRNLLVLNGHPDGAPQRLCHALCDAYVEGATRAGHQVCRLDLARLDFPILRSQDQFHHQPPPESIRAVQNALLGAEHWVLVYPLWLGGMPALLKALLEQTLRPDFAFGTDEKGWPKGRLQGHSARVVVTMGMPALAYRWFFGAHSLKSLERNILKFSGVKPVRETLFGMVDAVSPEKRAHWLQTMAKLGEHGS